MKGGDKLGRGGEERRRGGAGGKKERIKGFRGWGEGRRGMSIGA